MAGARQNDLNPNTYIGLALPLKSDNNNVFQLTKSSYDQVRHNLKNLLLTHIGERVYQPEFGSRLREICFEQLDDSLPSRVEDEQLVFGYLMLISKVLKHLQKKITNQRYLLE